MNGFDSFLNQSNNPNQSKLTPAQWKEFQEFKEEYLKKMRILTFQQQEHNDLMEGGLTSKNLSSFRNTMIFNEAESLDSDYPFIMDFEVIPETIKIVSVKVSFKIKKFRAYSKAGAVVGDLACIDTYVHNSAGVDYITLNTGDLSAYKLFTISGVWNLKSHVHPATYGIFEEDTSPTIHFYISERTTDIWKGKHGGYTEDQKNLDITSYLTDGNGEKMLKFTSDVRCRISARILLKLDIKAR